MVKARKMPDPKRTMQALPKLRQNGMQATEHVKDLRSERGIHSASTSGNPCHPITPSARNTQR